jgi:hypothetical protein
MTNVADLQVMTTMLKDFDIETLAPSGFGVDIRMAEPSINSVNEI